ncbi:MAG: polysaccharide biosynthesis/export family protein [Desulfuromonadales bacterium]|nr:polysaccharide biosynthesis/export family protein [Desulfuromonadales bacterium]
MKRFMLSMLMAGVVVFAVGCTRFTQYDPGTVRDIDGSASALLEVKDVKVPPPPVESADGLEYLVGPGDVLSVTVPDLIERRTGAERTNDTLGNFRVYSSGKIILPLVGAVEVAGLTIEQVQAKLVNVFSAYIRQPVVSVEIQEFKSQPLYLLGKFNKPGLYYLDRPTYLLHGLALGSGLQDRSNLSGARVVRNEKVLPVDIYALLYSNDMQQNILLKPGDTIYVPSNDEQLVYVFGAVEKPGPVPMDNGRLNILQALTVAGLHKNNFDHEHLRLIRTISPTHGQFMVVDIANIMDGKAMPLEMRDGDILYVPKTRLGNWNEAIAELLPTIQVLGAAAQPFLLYEATQDD